MLEMLLFFGKKIISMIWPKHLISNDDMVIHGSYVHLQQMFDSQAFVRWQSKLKVILPLQPTALANFNRLYKLHAKERMEQTMALALTFDNEAALDDPNEIRTTKLLDSRLWID